MSLRLCLSGDPACTGIAPCEPCSFAVRMKVLPNAMVAAGFNGTPRVASAFFDEYLRSHERLMEEAKQEILARIPPTATEAEVGENIGDHIGKELYADAAAEAEPAAALTADDIAAMGQVEDFAKNGEETTSVSTPFSPKAARALARKARRLKQKRAGKASTEQSKEAQDGQG